MRGIQQDVGTDLDRIAEICAGSRYSLSNQYEVHIAPQCSGASSFRPASSSLSKKDVSLGPTLQVISSDEEHMGSMQRTRRNTARKRSAAYGTLETIMSSSRSSDEDRDKKKSAAEIVDELRGREDSIAKDDDASLASTGAHANSKQDGQGRQIIPTSSLFVTTMINTCRGQMQDDINTTKERKVTLMSAPSHPQTSHNYLHIMTL